MTCVVASVAHAQEPASRPVFATRADVATLLMQARVGRVGEPSSHGQFDDVPSGAWYERYVVGAARFGILDPLPGTKMIRPEAPVTRGEFLEMLSRAFGLPAGLPSSYVDIVPNAWYAPYVGVAERYALFVDKDASLLHPLDGLRPSELLYAMRTFLDARGRERAGDVPANEAKVAKKQSVYQLTLTQKISTQTTEVSSVQMPFFKTNSSSSAPKAVPSGITPQLSISVPRYAPIVVLRQEALLATNQERLKAKAPPLVEDIELDQTAQRYAEKMSKENFFSHTSPEGEILSQRIQGLSLNPPSCFCIVHFVYGENLARDVESGGDAVNTWMMSKAHRDALLNPVFTKVGIGSAGGYWVQHFAGIKKE